MAFPGEVNIDYYKGDTYEFNIYPKLSNGTAMDLTDYSVKFTIAEVRGSSTNFKECYASIPQASGQDYPNYIKCAIRPEDGNQQTGWSGLTAGTTYYYDVEIKKTALPYNYVYTLLTGTVSITEQVTLS